MAKHHRQHKYLVAALDYIDTHPEWSVQEVASAIGAQNAGVWYYVNEGLLPEPPVKVKDKRRYHSAKQLSDGIQGDKIYFIRREIDGRIKIGRTYGPIEERMAQLFTGGGPMTLLAICSAETICVEDWRGAEQALHSRFAFCRVHGEWFDPVPELLEYIREMSV